MSSETHSTMARKPTEDPFADLDRLGDQIAELSAHIQAATYRLLVLIREFDAREGWRIGFRSCAHWLNWRTGLDLGAAREKVRVARALEVLPRISEAMRRGRVSYSKVRALTRVATADNEEELLEFALTGTAAHVETLVRAWRRVDRLEASEEDQRRQEHRTLISYTDDDGMLVVRARLTPEIGAVLLKALEAAADKLYKDSAEGEGPSWSELPSEQRQADALGLVAESALQGGLNPGTTGDRYQVVVHVEAEALQAPRQPASSGLADRELPGRNLDHGAPDNRAIRGGIPAAGEPETGVLETGVHVSAETSRRLGCESARVVMKHASDGKVLDVGRKTRAVHPALRRALTHRDKGCRFPGCGLRQCDAHHVEHWADGGKTKLDNLLLLCRDHHRAVHEGGYRVELDAAGEPRFTAPAGWVMTEAPTPPALRGDSATTLTRRHRAEGLRIDGSTSLPPWQGERLDLAFAIDAFRNYFS